MCYDDNASYFSPAMKNARKHKSLSRMNEKRQHASHGRAKRQTVKLWQTIPKQRKR